MKQLIFTVIAISFVLGANSQKEFKSNREYAKIPVEKTPEAIDKSTHAPPVITSKLNSSNKSPVDRHYIGMSGNIYSVLHTYQRCLTYEPYTGTLLATHRANPQIYPGTGITTMVAHTSVDYGVNWNQTFMPDSFPIWPLLRHSPNGVLYKPASGNTYDDLYVLISGRTINDDTLYCPAISGKLDESNMNAFIFPIEYENSSGPVSSMTIVPGEAYIFGANYDIVGSQAVNQTYEQYVFNTSNPAQGFSLETINTYKPDWLIDPVDGHAYALYATWSAWSADGSIGYMWMIGVTNETYDYGDYQPQVVFTTNGGDTWNPISIDMEDHPTLVEYLSPWEDTLGNPGTVRPTFLTTDRTYPGVVDYEGKLHLFSNVYGSSRGDVLDPDNGYWIVNDQIGGHIFDFIIDQNGLVDVIFVDSIGTDVAPENSFGNLGWTHRLQACKSPAEDAVFCVWSDDIYNNHLGVVNPDIYGWGYIVEGQELLGSHNFTAGDLFSGFYFFHFVSDLAIETGTRCWTLPVTTSLSVVEYLENDPWAPVTHTYLNGFTFCASNIDVNENLSPSLSLTQNIPNPARSQTSFSVVSKENLPLKLKVVNMIGQEVYLENLGKINGNKKVYLDLSEFKTGVYFYTVSSGNASATKKMIIR